MNKFRKKQMISIAAAVVTVGCVYAYNHFSITSAVKPTKIVLAAEDIPAHTKITEEMLVVKTVPGDAIPTNAHIKMNDVVGKWTTDGSSVAKNSFLFKKKVLSKNEMPDSAILNLKEGEVAFPLLVDIETSLGNSIVPGTNVDLYFLANKEVSENNGNSITRNQKIISGGLFQHLRVTAAKDSQTADAFKDQNNPDKKDEEKKNTVTRLYTLAVSPEQLQYLNRAKKLGQILPIATGTSNKKEVNKNGKFKVVSDQERILNYIEKNSINSIPSDVKQYVRLAD